MAQGGEEGHEGGARLIDGEMRRESSYGAGVKEKKKVKKMLENGNDDEKAVVAEYKKTYF